MIYGIMPIKHLAPEIAYEASYAVSFCYSSQSYR